MNRVTRRVLSALSRFNASHPWSHNTAYSPWVLRQARIVRRRGGERALDVGCGTGALAKRLASMTAPTREPSETFEQIASVASEILPGVRMRRGLFWRYTAVWVKSG